MRIRRALKAAIVALVSGGCIVQADLSLGRSLALTVGAALVTFAWIMLPREGRLTATEAPAAAGNCIDRRPSALENRISRTIVPRRLPRDVRCQPSRATARARRSTRR